MTNAPEQPRPSGTDWQAKPILSIHFKDEEDIETFLLVTLQAAKEWEGRTAEDERQASEVLRQAAEARALSVSHADPLA